MDLKEQAKKGLDSLRSYINEAEVLFGQLENKDEQEAEEIVCKIHQLFTELKYGLTLEQQDIRKHFSISAKKCADYAKSHPLEEEVEEDVEE